MRGLLDPDLHYLYVAQHNLFDLVSAENTKITGRGTPKFNSFNSNVLAYDMNRSVGDGYKKTAWMFHYKTVI